MILIVGATGLLGTDICRLLATEGRPVRAFVRPTADPAKVQTLKQLGAEIVQGDVREPASLDAACRGVDTVITTVSALPVSYQGDNTIQTVDVAGQMSLIDAARASGVTRFVYISYSANIGFDDPLTTAKRKVEQYLKDSGLTYTILRPSYFMESWLSPALGFDYPNASAQIYGDGHNKISWISRPDVARFAVTALANPLAKNTTIELGGPEALSPREVIQVFESATGRLFQVQCVPEEALRAQRGAATDPMQQSFAALMLSYALGDTIEMQTTAKAFDVQLTSVQEYAHSLVPA